MGVDEPQMAFVKDNKNFPDPNSALQTKNEKINK